MNTQNPKIKILISYHDKHPLIKSDILTPIQTGCALAKERFEGMLQDDDGDNISAKNPKYSEIAAQYWAWKNYDKLGNPDYIGFMHYRRHFIFNQEAPLPKDTWLPQSPFYLVQEASEVREYIGTDNQIIQQVQGTDCITVKPYDLTHLGHASIRGNYPTIFGAQAKDFDLLIETLKEVHPDYSDEIARLENRSLKYCCNMFVMPKDIFFRYNEFLFPVLEKLEEKIDVTYYCENYTRVLGYLAEIVFNVFYFRLQKENRRLVELNATFLVNANEEKIFPAFKNNATAFAVSCSNEYVPYLSVYLASLLEHATAEHNYDIVVFQHTITPENQEKLKRFCNRDNVSLRFVNPLPLLKKYSLWFPPQYAVECYFRLTAPELLPHHKKIIFTDVDLVFERDPWELAQFDLKGKPFGAVQDLIFGAFLNTPHDPNNWKEYAQKELNLKNPYNYINTGVLLLDAEKFRREKYSKKLLEAVSGKKYRILEQDLLNAFFDGQFAYLPDEWNFPTLNVVYKNSPHVMPASFKHRYLQAKKRPAVVHFAGGLKPWAFPEEDLADIWWRYARKTPYYEEILVRLNKKTIYEILNYELNMRATKMVPVYLRYLRYKLMAHVTVGKKRTHYKDACTKARNMVELLRQYRKLLP